jgi:hypothetical protein
MLLLLLLRGLFILQSCPSSRLQQAATAFGLSALLLSYLDVQNLPREESVFDISRLSQRILDTAGREIELEESFPLVDAEQQLRAALSKLRDHCVSLDALDAQGTFSMALENDKDSALGSDDRQQWVNVPQTGTAEDRCRGEHASNNVRIRSVEAGALAFEVWYGPVWTASRPSSDIPSQTQASHGSITSSSSDIYGTFPSSQRIR